MRFHLKIFFDNTVSKFKMHLANAKYLHKLYIVWQACQNITLKTKLHCLIVKAQSSLLIFMRKQMTRTPTLMFSFLISSLALLLFNWKVTKAGLEYRQWFTKTLRHPICHTIRVNDKCKQILVSYSVVVQLCTAVICKYTDTCKCKNTTWNTINRALLQSVPLLFWNENLFS